MTDLSDDTPARTTPTGWLTAAAIIWAAIGVIAWIYTWPKTDGGSDKVFSLLLLFVGLGLATVCWSATVIVSVLERRGHNA
jgi:hypothetical protein